MTTLDDLRHHYAITLYANPRGIFLTIHDDSEEATPQIVDSKRFETVQDALDWAGIVIAKGKKLDKMSP